MMKASHLNATEDNLKYWIARKEQIISREPEYYSIRDKTHYSSWQSASHTFYSREIYPKYSEWFYTIKWKKGRYGMHLKQGVPIMQYQIRSELAKKIGVDIENISPTLTINTRGENPTYHVRNSDMVLFNTYTVGYNYRTSTKTKEKYFDQARYDVELQAAEANIAYYQQVLEQGSNDIITQQIKIASENILLTKQIAEQVAKTYQQLTSMSDGERSHILVAIYHQQSKVQVVNIIKQIGFDEHDVAYKAYLNNDQELFDFASDTGASIGNYFVDGKTLLQHLIANNKEAMINKVLQQAKEFDSTIWKAVEQNDINTISYLCNYYKSDNANNLLSKKFFGCSLLQIAVMAQKEQIVSKILELDNTAINILNNNGESAFKIAIRIGNEQIIDFLSKYINIESELKDAGINIAGDLKTEIINNNDIKTLTFLLSGKELALTKYSAEDYINQDLESEGTKSLFETEDINISYDLQGLALNDADAFY